MLIERIKQMTSLLIIIALLLTLSSCGSSSSIQSYNGKTKMTTIEKQLGEPQYKEDDDVNRYSWMRYKPGTIFCGINCSYLEFTFSLENKTLTDLYFEALYEKTNADPIDNLIKDLTKKLGTPSIDKNSNSRGSYTEYKWDNDSTVIIRDDDEVLVTIYVAVDKERKAKEICDKGLDQFIAGSLWSTIQETGGVYLACTSDDLRRNKKVEYSKIDINGDDAVCEGQVELTIPLITNGEILMTFSFKADGSIKDTTWNYKFGDVETKVK